MACKAYLIVLVCVITMLCASCGPRMKDQVSLKPYEQPMPPMPAGTVPTTGRSATRIFAPVPNTGTTVNDGKIYYGYYCLMCHGEKGDGNGPVGESYVPKPADLTSSNVAALTDAQLYDRMLHGIGHDPVMEQTVIPKHRWPLVSYVRTLSKKR